MSHFPSPPPVDKSLGVSRLINSMYVQFAGTLKLSLGMHNRIRTEYFEHQRICSMSLFYIKPETISISNIPNNKENLSQQEERDKRNSCPSCHSLNGDRNIKEVPASVP